MALFRLRPRHCRWTQAGARLFPVVPRRPRTFATGSRAAIPRHGDRQPLRVTPTNAFPADGWYRALRAGERCVATRTRRYRDGQSLYLRPAMRIRNPLPRARHSRSRRQVLQDTFWPVSARSFCGRPTLNACRSQTTCTWFILTGPSDLEARDLAAMSRSRAARGTMSPDSRQWSI